MNPVTYATEKLPVACLSTRGETRADFNYLLVGPEPDVEEVLSEDFAAAQARSFPILALAESLPLPHAPPCW